MRTISDTIARLGAFRTMKVGAGPSVGGRLSELSGFGSNPGALKAKVFVPESLPDNAALVVVLHGCTQTAEAYDRGAGWSALAAREGFAVLYAEQRRENNANLCFNWFAPDDIQRESGEALSIRQMIEAVVLSCATDHDRIFISGLSAGGAMTSAMLATYPELFAGGAIIAGLPHGVAQGVPQAFDRMRGHGLPGQAELQDRLAAASSHAGPWPSISIWHGDADQTVSSTNAEAIAAQWLAVHRVDQTPTSIATVDGQQRRVWCDATGRERIESWTIHGMGHGTPLDTTGTDTVGAAGPFMLDVGISSTLHTARFWGIAPQAAGKPAARRLREAALRPAPEVAPVAGVGKVIEEALRAAGLMR